MNSELRSFLLKYTGTIHAKHINDAIFSGSLEEIMIALVDVAWYSNEITFKESEQLWAMAKEIKLAIGNKNE